MRFVAVERAFKPEVQVRATRDLNGPVERGKPERGKWHLGAGRTGHLDEETARVFAIKGHIEILDPAACSSPGTAGATSCCPA